MTYSTVEHKSYGSRLCNALSGVCVGLLFFILSFPVLFWNEGNYVQQAAAISELETKVIDALPDTVNKQNNLQPVCIRGTLTYDEEIIDKEYGIHAYGLRLSRTPESYQYFEHSTSRTEKTGGGGERTVTTYSYTSDWAHSLQTSLHDSAYRNPSNWKIRPQAYYGKAKLGVFNLPKIVIENIGTETEINILDKSYSLLGQAIAGSGNRKLTDKLLTGGLTIGAALKKDDTTLSSDKALISSVSALVKDLRIDGNYVYTGQPNQPVIGDNRAKWTIVRPETITLLGKQTTDGRIVPYTTSNQLEILLYAEGELSTDELIRKAESENSFYTWLIRFGGWFCMFIGFLLMFQPASILLDIVPFIGSFLSGMVSCGFTIVAFLVSVSLSLLIIAIAWFAYRPFFAIGLGILIAGLMWLTSKFRSSTKPKTN